MEPDPNTAPTPSWLARNVLLTPIALLVLGVVLAWRFGPRSIGSDGLFRIRVDLTQIASAIEEFSMNHDGHRPASLDELVTPDASGYRLLSLSHAPRDPWGREYLYVSGPEFNVLTLGRDGVPGGDGDDADIDYRTSAGGR